jgi:alpha-mannosidase
MAVELDSNLSPAAPAMSYFSLSSPNVILLAFKPSADQNPEHYTIRLQEIAGKETVAELTTPLKITAAEEISMTEDVVVRGVPISPLRVNLAPHETLTLCLTIPHPHKKRSERWWEWSESSN